MRRNYFYPVANMILHCKVRNKGMALQIFAKRFKYSKLDRIERKNPNRLVKAKREIIEVK